jgi:hypothetical protein
MMLQLGAEIKLEQACQAKLNASKQARRGE